MMNCGSPSLLAVQNSFWPFSYPIKPYDLSIHPAFIQSSYRTLQGIQYGMPTTTTTPPATHSNTSNSRETEKTKSGAFTIDAILNHRGSCKADRDNHSRDSSADAFLHSSVGKHEKYQSESNRRRQQRLFEAGHPYSEIAVAADNAGLQKHLQTTFKQFADSIRPEKSEKKSPESWSKQAKGKRVRTIFTPEQLERMEAEFERQQYMVGTERYYLATSLNLTEAQVKVWFQNRRIKWRKQHLEQQQAKLKSLDIYNDADSASDAESDDETHTSADENTHHLADPFQSPKEARYTQ